MTPGRVRRRAGEPPLTSDGFRAETGVSRETLKRLAAYADLLRRWQVKINLVGPSTLEDLWRRHMLDSAQLFPLLPAGARTLVDLGSGAGFPGLVLAIMGVPDVHLVESHRRRATFLAEAVRIAEAEVTVHAVRIEDLSPLPADVVTARALAPLRKLLEYAAPFLEPEGVGLFPRGRRAEIDLTGLGEIWHMRIDRIPSRTDPSATILRIGALRPAR